MWAPRRFISPLAENPWWQNMLPSTASPSALRAIPSGLEKWPPVQESGPLMWAPARRIAPLAENPWWQNMLPSTASPSALRAIPSGLEKWPPVQSS